MKIQTSASKHFLFIHVNANLYPIYFKDRYRQHTLNFRRYNSYFTQHLEAQQIPATVLVFILISANGIDILMSALPQNYVHDGDFIDGHIQLKSKPLIFARHRFMLVDRYQYVTEHFACMRYLNLRKLYHKLAHAAK